jgi:hypothetical protein
VGKIGRPIEWIDYPSDGTALSVVVPLFSQNRVGWESLPDAADDHLLGGQIHLRHKIDGTLLGNGEIRSESLEYESSRFLRRIRSDLNKPIDICHVNQFEIRDFNPGF